jgi:hypothetical protein
MSMLTPAEIAALHEALDDEYKAWTTYDQVIHDLGPEPPFIHIVESEARHVEALRMLFERYGVAVPGNPWAGRVPRFQSIREACEAGVEAEVENAALHERLMQSTRRADLLAVFENLRRASQERHLPAFRRGASRGEGGQGPGRGRGPRRGSGRRCGDP